MSAEKLVARLEQLELLDDQVLVALRKQIAAARSPVSPQAVAKRLVEQGHLTVPQAKKLLAALAADSEKTAPPRPTAAPPAAPPVAARPPAAAPPQPADDEGLVLLPDDEGLMLLPDDAPVAARPAPAKPPAAAPSALAPKAADDDDGLMLLADDEPASARSAPSPPPAAASAPPKPPADDDGLMLLSDDDQPAAPALAKAADSPPTPPAKAAAKAPAKSPAKAQPPKSPPAGANSPSRAPAAPAAGLTPIDDANELVALEELAELTPLDGDAMGGGGLESGGLGGGLGGGDMFSQYGAGSATGADSSLSPTPGGAAGRPVPGANLKQMKRGGWDSPLMMLGGGALLLLLFAGAVLVYSLSRGSADDLFALGEAAYKDQTYDKAILAYDKFLKNFPTHERASLVRVRKGLARLRAVVDVAKDMRSALEEARTSIPELEKEEKFGEGRDELAAMLPKIAEDFAVKAKAASTGKMAEEYTALGEQAMELVNNPSYISSQMRESLKGRIETIRRMLEDARRTILQDKALVDTLQRVQEATDSGKTAEAFEARRQLLKEYPGVENDAKLVEAVRAVAAKEKQLVRVVTESRQATGDEPAASQSMRLVLTHRRGETLAGQNGQIAYFLVRGSVFALDVPTGKTLWRRHVGHETTLHPQPISKDAGADALVVDSRSHELLRLEARTGKLVWRLTIGESFAAPTAPGEKWIVVTQSGRLFEVDPETGNSARSLQLPQNSFASAGGDSRLPTFFQVGEHSNLYVVASDTLECPEVFYLGHKAGSIVVPPALALNHLFIAENAGPDYCLVRIVAVDAGGVGLKEAQAPFRLAGNVMGPISQVKNRVVVATNLGEIVAFEVDATKPKTPVVELARQTASSKSPEPAYASAEASTVWIGGNRLSSFDIQTSRSQFNGKWVQHEGEPFVAPLQRFGSVLLHARRRRGASGVTVAASRVDSGQVLWRTELAVSAAYVGGDAPRKQFVVISTLGDVYRVGGEALKSGFVDQPTETVEADGAEVAFAFSEPAPLGEGRILLSNQLDRRHWLVFNPEKTVEAARITRLTKLEKSPAVPPTPLAGGVLVCDESGRVELLDADTGRPKLLPFQPRLEPGASIEWRAPATIADGKEFVVANQHRKLFRVGPRDKPQPHLAAIQELESPVQAEGSLVATGDSLYLTAREGSEDLIQAFSLPSLAVGAQWKLKGRVQAGPWRAGDVVFWSVDEEGLVCFGPGQKRRWSAPLADGPLAAPPIFDGKSFVVATQRGRVSRLDPETGEERSHVVLGEPLQGPAAAFGASLLFTTSDGMLLLVRDLP